MRGAASTPQLLLSCPIRMPGAATSQLPPSCSAANALSVAMYSSVLLAATIVRTGANMGRPHLRVEGGMVHRPHPDRSGRRVRDRRPRVEKLMVGSRDAPTSSQAAA